MKKLYISILICLLPTQLVSLQSSKAPGLWERLKVNTQGLTNSLKRAWYGAEQAAPQVAQRPTPRTQQSYFRGYAQGIRQSPWVQKPYEYAQQTRQFVKKRPVLTAVGGAVATVIILEAQNIADSAREIFNPDIFDEELISDEFSRAIVRIHNLDPKEGFSEIIGSGTAFIIRSEQNPDVYFALTAAHCVFDRKQQVLDIKDKSRHSRYLRLKPLIVDRDNDIAILLISSEASRFKELTGTELPAIPAKQLSNVKPREKEIIALQGYPGFISEEEPFYRHQFISEGPATWQKHKGVEFSTPHLEESLHGASGSPLIAIRNKKPRVMGVISTQRISDEPVVPPAKKPGYILGTGVGQLPRYVQEAEKERKKNLS